MKKYAELSKEELLEIKKELSAEYEKEKALNLSLNMARGKPSSEQLDLTKKMLEITDYTAADGTDCRNYGLLDGIPEAKALFAEILGVDTEQVIVCGNSSLNLMYDNLLRAMQFGVLGSEKPWCKYDKIKFLCPCPGYDRHFAITEALGIEMIPVKMNSDGPDMDTVEKLVSEDETIKGIWCVPMYSNPDGITYSDDVVRRFARLSPKASDFRIFWDNAYCLHHLSDTPDKLLNIFDECKKHGSENMVYEFASTSKISFSGGGVAVVAASKENADFIRKQMSVQTIGFDKINQLRHVKFFKNADGIREHMKKHAALIKPRFDVVMNALDSEILPLGIADYKKPNGGYFISLYTMDGCAKRTVALCKEAGLVLTGAGAAYPYGKDEH
ncbi:MAG: aminotransferase, partial [Oscillospiraceae bacterium]